MQSISIHWFRRDLRLEDNAALYYSLKSGLPVMPIFIFDINILEELKEKDVVLNSDKRIIFIQQQLCILKESLNHLGSDLLVLYGNPIDVWKELITTYTIKKVYTNHDYELYAIKRDTAIQMLLAENKITFHTYKDQVIFEKNEVLKDDGKPYTVFTPYSKKWKLKWKAYYSKSYPTEKYFSNFIKVEDKSSMISIEELGFKNEITTFPTKIIEDALIQNYANTRDIPSVSGTSRLSVHLRFGTISIRKLVQHCMVLKGEQPNGQAEKFLNELIWRDFYMMILFHFPKVITQSFNEKYDAIQWRNNETEFKAWCEGKTGYPIVDAGIRELNATGYMHNRVRMITASFLCKHLLIDWRLGEAYFAKKLLDFDLSANNGGWQWAAGTGVDAAPYFRIFNPKLQTEKFDKNLKYIKKWVPEVGTQNYVLPIVEHEYARKRCLETYKVGLGNYEF